MAIYPITPASPMGELGDDWAQAVSCSPFRVPVARLAAAHAALAATTD